MSSFLARLRKRTLSQQSSTSAQVTAMPTSPALVNEALASSSPLAASRSEPSLVDRRIIHDLPAFLQALEQTNDQPGALRPLRPRKRSGLASLMSMGREQIPTTADPDPGPSEKESRALSSPLRRTKRARWKGEGGSSGPSRPNTGTTSSPWSTFGRHRQHMTRAPYGSALHSVSGSYTGRSAMQDSSSNSGAHTSSNVASTSSITRADSSQDHCIPSVAQGSPSTNTSQLAHSNFSHPSVAVVRSESSLHTFGGQSPSDRRARSPSTGLRSPSMTHIAEQEQSFPAFIISGSSQAFMPDLPLLPLRGQQEDELPGSGHATQKTRAAATQTDSPSRLDTRDSTASSYTSEQRSGHQDVQPPYETDLETRRGRFRGAGRRVAMGMGDCCYRQLPSLMPCMRRARERASLVLHPALYPPLHRFPHRRHC
ncbi:hypothetical protein BV20DRAFT_762842 [Pilatotrama ljubarskyi]|nr:hypothetical protein BV20DRAFT_762842 [Pilatotrama ljubarskyi]